MKATIFKKSLISLGFLLISISLAAQIKVESNGRVQVGAPTDTVGNDPTLAASLQIFGKGANGSLGKITFGNFKSKTSNQWNVFVGEYLSSSNGDTDMLWLQGKNGFKISSGGDANTSVILYDKVYTDYIYITPPVSVHGNLVTSNGNLYANAGDVYARGVKLTSDERLKKDVKSLPFGSVSSLQQLNSVSYFFKDTLLKKEERIKGNRELQFGFLAQDVQKIYPNLVKENEQGWLTIDYIGLIPIIVENIKEQQQIINAQSEKIKELEKAVSKLSGVATLRSGTDDNSASAIDIPNSELTNAFLYQNVPNPFNERTEIRYFLPEEVKSAEIYVFDMQGTLLKRVPADKSGSVEIKGADLKAGMYLYALVADGKQVDTKRMILTK